MKGLIYVVLIVVFSFVLVCAVKIVKSKIANKKESESITPKIYYVTKTQQRAKKTHGITMPINVEGAIIEKQKKR
ncbi:MAG: hypothetical protein IKL82_01310 [Clostridia bacterium]|nr:hypothetical protein [Clostridia bacterium]